jgi:hypothetical protein
VAQEENGQAQTPQAPQADTMEAKTELECLLDLCAFLNAGMSSV